MNDNKKAVMLSLKPTWLNLILHGEKKKEVRKRAPLLKPPFKVYFYCTMPNTKDPFMYLEVVSHVNHVIHKINGHVAGEAICTKIETYERPFGRLGDMLDGTALIAKEMYDYVANSDRFSFMVLENPVTYEKPKELVEFGLKRAPQSWCYVDAIKE